MNIEDRIAVGIPIWRGWVEENGGQWVGVQMPFPGTCFSDDMFAPPDEPRVMFTRVGSTTILSLTVSQCGENSIKEKLGKKVTKEVTKNVMSVDNMQSLADRLRDLAETVEAHIRWMEETK
jgi:hypothetical protein